jgi:hypothetical protein
MDTMNRPVHWTARAVRVLIAAALGLLTAMSSDYPPVIFGLLLILVPFVFVGSIFLMELVPAWGRSFDSAKRQRISRVLFVLAIFLVIYLLIALRQIEGIFGGKAHLWLFVIYLALFVTSAELLKLGFVRGKAR